MRLRDPPPAILANQDGCHPHRLFTATRIRKAPAPLSPRGIAQDVNIEVVCHHLDVVVTGGGHGIEDLLARLPLTGVGPDVDGIRTLRKPGAKPTRVARVCASIASSSAARTSSGTPVPAMCPPQFAPKKSMCVRDTAIDLAVPPGPYGVTWAM
jgi:hypothetical protein